MSDALKSCPFCGGEAELIEHGKDWWVVQCKAHRCSAGLGIGKVDPKRAIAAWNRRAPTSDGCEYCNIVKANQNVTPVDNTTMCGMRLKYCPNCGRGLGDKG